MTETASKTRTESISFQQLRLFESAGRLQSLRRAAAECNLSQPAVTQALAKLEQQVGVTLLARSANGSYLTDLGSLFHRRVVRFVERMERALVNLGIPGGHAAAPVFAKRLVRSRVRILIALVENDCFPQAAEVLCISPTSLLRAVRDLELDLRRPLFHRTSDGIMPTQAAVQFGLEMKLAMQEVEWGITEVETVQGGINSTISIGAMPGGGSILLASVLDEFVAAYPRVEVRIINAGSSSILKSLRAGNVDFVIGLLQEKLGPDFATQALMQTPYVIAVRRGHRLLYMRKVTVEDLRSYDWVVGLPGSSRRRCFDALFATSPPPRAPIVTSSWPVIRHLLERSDRLTIMTSYELKHEMGALAEVPFGPLEPEPAIGITVRADWQPTQRHADFIGLFQRRAGEFATQPRLAKVAS